MFITDIFETAAIAEDYLEIDLYLDLVFDNEELNSYFNYSYNYENDVITINFELDEGSAQLKIEDAQSSENTYLYNDILIKHINNTKEKPELWLNG